MFVNFKHSFFLTQLIRSVHHNSNKAKIKSEFYVKLIKLSTNSLFILFFNLINKAG